MNVTSASVMKHCMLQRYNTIKGCISLVNSGGAMMTQPFTKYGYLTFWRELNDFNHDLMLMMIWLKSLSNQSQRRIINYSILKDFGHRQSSCFVQSNHSKDKTVWSSYYPLIRSCIQFYLIVKCRSSINKNKYSCILNCILTGINASMISESIIHIHVYFLLSLYLPMSISFNFIANWKQTINTQVDCKLKIVINLNKGQIND